MFRVLFDINQAESITIVTGATSLLKNKHNSVLKLFYLSPESHSHLVSDLLIFGTKVSPAN
jgi:hypothetical protein